MDAIAKGFASPARRARADSKRAEILRGAKVVFLKQGFGGATMDAVAALTGISKMTLYRHFGSKEDLFAGVITDLCERIADEDLEEIFQRPPREALRAFAKKMIKIVFADETIELHRIVVAESRRFSKLGRFFYQSGPEACIAVLETYFERNIGNRRFKIHDPRRSAEEFLELLRGYAHLRVLLGLEKAPSPRKIEELVERAVDHVLI